MSTAVDDVIHAFRTMARILARAIKALAAVFAAVLATGILAGCGPAGTDADPIRVNGPDGDGWRQVTVELPDSRRVQCIAANNEIRTCDWAHASGADDAQ